MKNTNLSLHISKQDSFVSLLLAVFVFLLPFSALLPHARLLLLSVLLLFLVLMALRPSLFPVPASPFVYETEREKRRKRHLLLSDLFFLAYTLCVLSGCVLSKAIFHAIMSTILCFYRVLTRKIPTRPPFYPLLLGGAATAVTALLEYGLGKADTAFADVSRFGALARAGGVFGNPNLLAAYLLPLFAIALSALDERREETKRLLPLLLLLGGGIAVSYSRGAWAVALLWIGLFVLRRFGFFRPFLLLLAALPLFSVILPQSVTERLLSCFSPDSSVGYRFSLWQSILRLPPTSLLFGVGEGKQALLAALSPYMAAGLEKVEHTHSLFFHLVTANGVMGMAFFLLSLFFGFRERPKGVRRALLSFLLFGMFDDPLYGGQNEVLFWLLTGVF